MFLDNNIENQVNQTNFVAETILQDIRQLTKSYQDAMQNSQLVEHSEKVHRTQMKWVQQLQGVVQNHGEASMNSKLISVLHKFANNLNKNNQQVLENNLLTGMEEPIQMAETNLSKQQISSIIIH